MSNEPEKITPAPSVVEAINALSEGKDRIGRIQPPVEPVEETVHIDNPAEDVAMEDVRQALQDRRTEIRGLLQERPATFVLPEESHEIAELGPYVTSVMEAADRAASEYRTKIEAEGARRAAMLTAQAASEAQMLRAAAYAEAERIRTDAEAQAEAFIAARITRAVELTDHLYRQAERLLAGASNPEAARQDLAQFMEALTSAAEAAAENTTDETGA